MIYDASKSGKSCALVDFYMAVKRLVIYFHEELVVSSIVCFFVIAASMKHAYDTHKTEYLIHCVYMI